MNEESNSRFIYNRLAENWILSSAITIIPVIVEMVTVYYKDEKHNYYIIGLLVISIIFTIVRNKCITINQKKKINTDIYYQHLINSDSSLKNHKKEDILDIISKNEYKKIVKHPLKPYNNPASRINSYRNIKIYCDNIKDILVKDFDTIDDDVGISIFYINTIDCKKNTRWEVLYSSYNRHDGTPDMVLMEHGTSFANVKDDIGKLYFKEKKNAAQEFSYRPSRDEIMHGLKGSIYCKNISINYKNIKLPLVLCVATYESKICCDDDFYARQKVINFLKTVEDNIQYELIQLMLFKHMGFSKNFIWREK